MASTFEDMAAAIIAKMRATPPTSSRLPNPPGLKEDCVPSPEELFSGMSAASSTSSMDSYSSGVSFDHSEYSDDEYDTENSETFDEQEYETEEMEEPSYPAVDIETYPTNDLVKLIATRISRIVEANDSIQSNGSALSHGNTLHARRSPWQFLTPQFQEQTLKAWPDTPFFAENIFDVSVEEYLSRVVTWCKIPNKALLALSIYLDEIVKLSDSLCGNACHEEKPFVLNSFTVFRAIIVGIYVGAKYHTGESCDASYYAKVS